MHIHSDLEGQVQIDNFQIPGSSGLNEGDDSGGWGPSPGPQSILIKAVLHTPGAHVILNPHLPWGHHPKSHHPGLQAALQMLRLFIFFVLFCFDF